MRREYCIFTSAVETGVIMPMIRKKPLFLSPETGIHSRSVILCAHHEKGYWRSIVCYFRPTATRMQLLLPLFFTPLLLGPSLGMTSSHKGDSSLPSWDEFAHEYERRVEPFTSKFAEELIARLPNSGRQIKLLDVGCGTGAVALLGLSKGWEVAVTDASEAMVDRTVERAKDGKVLLDSAVVHGEDLPSRWSNSFDVVLANFSVIFFPQPVQGLRETLRCLREGTGRVGLTAWGDVSETPAFCVFKDVLAQDHPELVDSNKPKRITGSVEVLQNLLEEAGFVDVKVEGPIFKQLVVQNASEYYNRFALTSPPTAATIAKMAPKVQQKFRERVMEVATSRGGQPDGSIVLESGAYIAFGRKP